MTFVTLPVHLVESYQVFINTINILENNIRILKVNYDFCYPSSLPGSPGFYGHKTCVYPDNIRELKVNYERCNPSGSPVFTIMHKAYVYPDNIRELKVSYGLCYTSGSHGFTVIKHAYAHPRKTVNQNSQYCFYWTIQDYGYGICTHRPLTHNHEASSTGFVLVLQIPPIRTLYLLELTFWLGVLLGKSKKIILEGFET